MLAREVDVKLLDQEIARRAARPRPNKRAQRMSLDQMSDRALRLIEEGKREVAADLFRAARQADPADAEAHNNYGFCVLPDDPAESLEALELARSLGFDNGAVNALDRMQCHVMLGRTRAAMRIAAQVLSDWDDVPPRMSSYLWSFPVDGGPRLIAVRDARPVVMAMASQICEDATEREIWIKRHEAACAEQLAECDCLTSVPPHR